MKFTVSIDLSDDEQFILSLIDKQHYTTHTFEAKSYSLVLGKAYSHLVQELKKTRGGG